MTEPQTLAEFYERRDPRELQECIADAITAMRLHEQFAQHPDPKVRTMAHVHAVRAVQTAEWSGRRIGPRFVLSAAGRARDERRTAAKSYGDGIARMLMGNAGFAPADYEYNADDIAAMVRAEVHRQLTEAGLEEFCDE